MKRTISAMVGKGSLTHNRREFHAENVDPARSHLNRCYCDDNIREVYHQLFDDAVSRYNSRQKRKDRCINDYYEKIRIGKQEKLFHELIIQIGNCEDMSATTENGNLAQSVLDAYMQGFQQRNPTLRVFSAHLHMDEATPHLHIDFIPYITGSKRGVDTRVSLKQALAALGFQGGSRGDTEWNMWVAAEKHQLSQIMERYGIQWEQLDTHREHLTVLDYKKQERTREIADLEQQLSVAQQQLQVAERAAETTQKKAASAQHQLDNVTMNIKQAEQYAAEFQRSPEEWIPEPGALEGAKAFRKRILPLIAKVGTVIRTLYAKYLDLKAKNARLSARNKDLKGQIDNLSRHLTTAEAENKQLKEQLHDFDRAKTMLGAEVVDNAVQTARDREQRKQTKAKMQDRQAR